jgi:hypothetical protein
MTKAIKEIITTFLQLLTIIIILLLILYRFRIKLPKDIFFNPTQLYFIIYLIIFLLNCFFVFILLLVYKNITLNSNNKVIQFIKTWLEKSYEKFMDIIANIPGALSIMLAYITSYYLRIPHNIIIIVTYIPRCLLIIYLIFDVFYLQRFHYSYYVIYLLLFTLISKGIWYISYEIDKRCLEEIKVSVTMVTPEKTIREIYTNSAYKINENDFKLTENNKSFTTVKEALEMQLFVTNEIKELEQIKKYLETKLLFQLLIRFCYILVFGYIIYNYPSVF